MQLVKLCNYFPTVFVGVVFVVSAILKLMGMASFEMYMYEVLNVSFEFASVVSRLVVAVEIILGIALIVNLWYADCVSEGVLVIFSFFLVYMLLQGSTESCHCMGDAFDLSPGKSLVKNVLLIFILFFGPRRTKWLKYQKKPFLKVVAAISLVSVVAVFAVNRPDFMRIVKGREYNQEQLTLMLQREYPLALEGNKVVCILSTHCGKCKMAARRMEGIFKMYGWKDYEVLTVFSDTKIITKPIAEQVDTFFKETKVKRRNVAIVDQERLAEVAPNVPTIFLLNNGVVIKTYGYRNIVTEDFKKR